MTTPLPASLEGSIGSLTNGLVNAAISGLKSPAVQKTINEQVVQPAVDKAKPYLYLTIFAYVLLLILLIVVVVIVYQNSKKLTKLVAAYTYGK
jgi:hypothetical protein